MKSLSHVRLFATPWTTRLLHPWDSPGKNTGVGYCFLLQGIFLTQELNPSLLHLPYWQADSLPLNLLGSPCVVSIVHIFLFLVIDELSLVKQLSLVVWLYLSLLIYSLVDIYLCCF